MRNKSSPTLNNEGGCFLNFIIMKKITEKIKTLKPKAVKPKAKKTLLEVFKQKLKP